MTSHKELRAHSIGSIEFFPVVLPLKKPIVMSTYRIDEAPILFVRLRTTRGAEGWGEAAPNAVMSGETLRGMLAAAEDWVRPWLLGRGVHGCRHETGIHLGRIYGNGALKAAIDMALLDLEGRILGVPATMLLGGPWRGDVSVVRLIGRPGVRETVDEACALAAEGFTAFKLKVAVLDLAQDIETVAQLRRELGAGAMIGTDANMGWDLRTAGSFTSAITAYDVAFLEQPLDPAASRDMADLTARSDVPISGDESIHGVQDMIDLAGRRAIRGASLKTNKLGGVGAVVHSAAVASALGLSVNLAMMMESSLASAALVHAAGACPRIDWGLVLGNLQLAVDPVTAPLVCERGAVEAPLGPGLGVEVDLKLLERFRAS